MRAKLVTENLSEHRSAEEILDEFESLDFKDKNLDLSDITDEVMELPDGEFYRFFELGKKRGLIVSEDDGWDWVIPGEDFGDDDEDDESGIPDHYPESGVGEWSWR